MISSAVYGDTTGRVVGGDGDCCGDKFCYDFDGDIFLADAGLRPLLPPAVRLSCVADAGACVIGIGDKADVYAYLSTTGAESIFAVAQDGLILALCDDVGVVTGSTTFDGNCVLILNNESLDEFVDLLCFVSRLSSYYCESCSDSWDELRVSGRPSSVYAFNRRISITKRIRSPTLLMPISSSVRLLSSSSVLPSMLCSTFLIIYKTLSKKMYRQSCGNIVAYRCR